MEKTGKIYNWLSDSVLNEQEICEKGDCHKDDKEEIGIKTDGSQIKGEEKILCQD